MYKNIIKIIFLLTASISIINTSYAEYAEKVTQVIDNKTIKVFVGQSDKDKKSDTEKKNVKYSGKVTDVNGKPLAGAKVGLYKITVNAQSNYFETKLVDEVTMKEDGIFEFNVDERGFDGFSIQQWLIVAEKEGLSFGWNNPHPKKNSGLDIQLTKPGILSGIVVDESNSPVSDAEVTISMMAAGEEGQRRYSTSVGRTDRFLVKTDGKGKFSFNNIPLDASAELMVSKSGRATINTFDSGSFRGGNMRYTPGQTDIKIILPIEAKIEGKVIEKTTREPLSDVKVFLSEPHNRPLLGIAPVSCRNDGTFEFKGLAAGNYLLKIISLREGMADWVSEPVDVNVEAGKTRNEIIIEASKGGILEVLVIDLENKPLEDARISLQASGDNQMFGSKTDKNGVANTRLMQGEYKLIYVFKEGYSYDRRQDMFTIEDNKTEKIKVQLKSQPKISGVVRDPAGKPLEGIEVKIFPGGGESSIKTNSEGKFEVSGRIVGPWEPGQFPCYLVVRDEKRNLAGSVEVNDNQNPADIKLKPGVVIKGKVLGPDKKGISQARVTVGLTITNGRMSFMHPFIPEGVRTNTNGEFTVNAIPLGHKFYVEATADGYGRKYVHINSDDAEDNHIDLEQLELKVANLSLSGIVVDNNDKPVSGVQVSISGEEQPSSHVTTGTDGKFKIEKVCPGRIHVNAYIQGKNNLHGYIQTEGGAEDVKIVVSQQSSQTRYVPRQPPKLAGKKLPELENFNVELSQADTNDKKILVCFWDFNQRPSRHIMSELAKQAEQLKQKGVTIVAIQTEKADKNTLDEWVKKLNIPFTIGMIQEDSEKTQFKWGVKSLPWFILADNNQIITAEGFSLSQLDDKIK